MFWKCRFQILRSETGRIYRLFRAFRQLLKINVGIRNVKAFPASLSTMP
jgi:hypothetical protein